MPTPLEVTLDETTTPWTVDIDEVPGGNRFHQNPVAQTVEWILKRNAAAATFKAFRFLPDQTPDPSQIFGEPCFDRHRKRLGVIDRHVSPATSGTWIYYLEIELDGKTYSTTSSTAAEASDDARSGDFPIRALVSNNPKIKNT